MPLDSFRDKVLRLPVFDTHTHLNIPGVPVAAQSVWDIVHYFWFKRELVAAGYPSVPMELEEDARFRALHQALRFTRNTSWNWAVRQMVRDLYGMVLDSEDSLRELDDAVRASATRTGWPREVVGRLGIDRITVNSERDADLPGLRGVGCALPSQLGSSLGCRCDALLQSSSFRSELEEQVAAIRGEVAALWARGIRGLRVDLVPYDIIGDRAYDFGTEPPAGPGDPDHVRTYLFCVLFDAMNEHGMLAQLFLGMKRKGQGDTIPVDTAYNDTGRIVRLHPLFHRYGHVRFELVMGCELNNMDVVQAARIYPNVNPGGLWWFNFRVSSYLQAMQYRFEALPANRCAVLATDARCIEWCYAKTLLVKTVLAQFFRDQIQRGWIDAEDALWTARWWLHDTAACHYVSGE